MICRLFSCAKRLIFFFSFDFKCNDACAIDILGWFLGNVRGNSGKVKSVSAWLELGTKIMQLAGPLGFGLVHKFFY